MFVEIVLAVIAGVYLAIMLRTILLVARDKPFQSTLNGLSLIGFVLVAGGVILAFSTEIWSDALAGAFVVFGVAVEFGVHLGRRRRAIAARQAGVIE